MNSGPAPRTPPRAVVALAAAPGQGRSLVPLLAIVGTGHRVVSWHRSGVRGADVVVASDPAVLGDVLSSLGASGRPRVACRVRSTDELERARDAGADATFTDDPDLAGAAADGGPSAPQLVPSEGIDVARHPAIPPLTRARLREAYGIAGPLVLAVDRRAPARTVSTSLALASAVVVADHELLPLALALGTPVVVARPTADRYGVEDGSEVLVAPTAEPRDADALAASLARDEARSAHLSHRARRYAERALDVGAPARALRRTLGLEPVPALIDLRLDELATPPASRLRDRARDALDIFTTEPRP